MSYSTLIDAPSLLSSSLRSVQIIDYSIRQECYNAECSAYAAELLLQREHHDDLRALLPHHSPEVLDRRRQRALRRDVLARAVEALRRDQREGIYCTGRFRPPVASCSSLLDSVQWIIHYSIDTGICYVRRTGMKLALM